MSRNMIKVVRRADGATLAEGIEFEDGVVMVRNGGSNTFPFSVIAPSMSDLTKRYHRDVRVYSDMIYHARDAHHFQDQADRIQELEADARLREFTVSRERRGRQAAEKTVGELRQEIERLKADLGTESRMVDQAAKIQRKQRAIDELKSINRAQGGKLRRALSEAEDLRGKVRSQEDRIRSLEDALRSVIDHDPAMSGWLKRSLLQVIDEDS